MSDPHHIEMLAFAHGMVAKAADFPADKAVTQAPGQPNHCLWTMGHLAETYEWAAGLLDGQPGTLPEHYGPLFNMGSKPSPDAATYPPVAEVRAAFEGAYARLLRAARTLTPTQLEDSVHEATHGFASTKRDALAKIAWHDGWHLGQLTTLRGYLGLPKLLS